MKRRAARSNRREVLVGYKLKDFSATLSLSSRETASNSWSGAAAHPLQEARGDSAGERDTFERVRRLPGAEVRNPSRAFAPRDAEGEAIPSSFPRRITAVGWKSARTFAREYCSCNISLYTVNILYTSVSQFLLVPLSLYSL